MKTVESIPTRSVMPHRPEPSLLVALMLLACTWCSRASDVYTPSNQQLTVPNLLIGGATWSNVVVTVGRIVSGPTGSSPEGSVDSYDPSTALLTVRSVVVDGTTYFNAVVTVASLVSIGSVTGADSFNGTYLKIPSVQAGSASYSNVTLAASAADVISIGQGLPQRTGDEFDSASGRLSIAAVQVGSRVYTNVVIRASLADIVAVGPAVSIAQVQKDIFTPHCAACHNPYIPMELGTLDLSTASASAAELVNVPSFESVALRVKPGDPDASYLIQKIKGTSPIIGSRMPLVAPFLTPAQVEEVSAWILGL